MSIGPQQIVSSYPINEKTGFDLSFQELLPRYRREGQRGGFILSLEYP